MATEGSEITPLTTPKNRVGMETTTSSSGSTSKEQRAYGSLQRWKAVWIAVVMIGLLLLIWVTSCRFPDPTATSKSSMGEEGHNNGDLIIFGSHENDDDWMPNVKIGNYSFPITIQSAPDSTPDDIQHLFDSGLVNAYGFAFDEALRAAQKAIAKSTHCPMCYWLMAMAYAPYINHPVATQENYQKGAQAAKMAAIHSAAGGNDDASKEITLKEQALIEAINLRFGASYEKQTVGYQQYQSALGVLHTRLPHDTDVMAFLADAIMVLHCDDEGYHFYQDDNITPQPGIVEAIHLLQKCLTSNPSQSPHHPLCLHLYIHITEPSYTANRAEHAADRLAALVQSTQAQHLQHMPSHTYLRVGRYHDAIAANVLAHTSDEAFLRHGHVPYGPAHDMAFLVHAAQTSGERTVAYEYADTLRHHYQQYPDRGDYPNAELGWHIWRTVRLRFGEFDEIFRDQNDMPRDWPYAQVLGHYTKGVAYLATTENTKQAKEHWQALQENMKAVQASFQPVARIANWTLASAIEYRDGNLENALELVRKARIEQENWAYTEPPAWHMTMAQCEGTLLRIMGHVQEAIAMFEHDLKRVPENRQSLYGLQQALRMDPGADDRIIENIQKRLREASKWADEPDRPPIVCTQLGE